MARRNPAFRIATGGLTMAVVLCLVAAISLWKDPFSTQQNSRLEELAGMSQDSSAQTPIQVAHEGEVDGILSDSPQRPVPDPQDFVEQPQLDQIAETREDSLIAAPGEPTDTTLPDESEQPEVSQAEVNHEHRDSTVQAQAESTPRESLASVPFSGNRVEVESSSRAAAEAAARQMEAEIAALKGQINELARTQLENQLEEIRHAEQLLTTHQSTRMIESLQREVDQLKAERQSTAPLNTQATIPEGLTEPTESVAEDRTERNAEPIKDSEPLRNDPSTTKTTESSASASRVRFSESTETPGRYDVEADEATLQEFVAVLGPVAGWNLVSGPELTGTVTLRWSRVELREALAKQLKARGWQIREDGEFALIEAISIPTTRTAAVSSTTVSDPYRPLSTPITLELAPRID